MDKKLYAVMGHINENGPSFLEVRWAISEAQARAITYKHQEKVHARATVRPKVDGVRQLTGLGAMESFVRKEWRRNPLINIFIFGTLREPLSKGGTRTLGRRSNPRPFRLGPQMTLFGRLA